MRSARLNIHLSIFITGVVLAMAGFVFSRAMLSIGTIVLIVNRFIQNDLKERWKLFLQSKLLVGICCLFLLPFISGLWSEDKQEWLQLMQIKVPLLLLPFALVMQKGFTKNILPVYHCYGSA